jgi:hypothetical protein
LATPHPSRRVTARARDIARGRTIIGPPLAINVRDRRRRCPTIPVPVIPVNARGRARLDAHEHLAFALSRPFHRREPEWCVVAIENDGIHRGRGDHRLHLAWNWQAQNGRKAR